MKWWFLFFLRGISMSGPYETEQECLAELKVAMTATIPDQGFDNAKANGWCVQASQPH